MYVINILCQSRQTGVSWTDLKSVHDYLSTDTTDFPFVSPFLLELNVVSDKNRFNPPLSRYLLDVC